MSACNYNCFVHNSIVLIQMADIVHCQVAAERLSRSPGLVAVGGGGGPLRLSSSI